MALGSDLPRLRGYPFDGRYSKGDPARAEASAEVAARAYLYLVSGNSRRDFNDAFL
jgi:hypothetical protein